MSEITSRPYKPAMACEACCFGAEVHAEWCERARLYFTIDWENSPRGSLARERYRRALAIRDDKERDAWLDGSRKQFDSEMAALTPEIRREPDVRMCRERYIKALEMTPEQRRHWLEGSWDAKGPNGKPIDR